MSFKAKVRLFHRKTAPWLVPSLLLLAVTGLIYRMGRTWFGMSKETGGRILHLHSGEWFGDNGSVIYLFLVGGMLLFLIGSGLAMVLTSKRPKGSLRGSHRLVAIIVSLPLILSTITGVALQAGENWFNAGEGTLKLLLSLHQGTWLGTQLRPFYILLLGVGLISLCLTGMRMLVRKKPHRTD